MITVSVASGKGGAGKTSIAAALASILASEGESTCVFADCDVDAANGAIALGSTILQREPYFAGPGFIIDLGVCIGCGRCMRRCRFGAVRFAEAGPGFAIIPELCERCGACADICPVDAIGTFDKQAGELFVSGTKSGISLVHAELEPGEDTSGKLVRAVRERAAKIAESSTSEAVISEAAAHAGFRENLGAGNGGSASFVVVDAPPGIGCPVIASLAGTDLVILVVEASLSGIRDARRLSELLESMKRKTLAIINKT